MKRFHLFAYSTYYPGGGLADYQGDFRTLEQAKDHLPKVMANDSCIENAHVAFTQEVTGTLVVVAYWNPDQGWVPGPNPYPLKDSQ